MKIVYWSDFACPYCYIGVTNLRNALEAKGVEDVSFEMRAFELDPYAPKKAEDDIFGRFMNKYRLSEEETRARIKSIDDMGAEAGIDMNFGGVLYLNTFDAHRLLKMAESKDDPEMVPRLTERLYRAYFTENLDISLPEVLLKIGTEEGLDPEETEEMLKGKAFEEEVMIQEREAHMKRLTSVPYFIIDEKIAIPGAMPQAQFEMVIDKLKEMEQGS